MQREKLVCGYTPVNLGKIIKDGILSDIDSIHRITIDAAVSKKSSDKGVHCQEVIECEDNDNEKV